jgi:hypothetical protein
MQELDGLVELYINFYKLIRLICKAYFQFKYLHERIESCFQSEHLCKEFVDSKEKHVESIQDFILNIGIKSTKRKTCEDLENNYKEFFDLRKEL